MSKQGKAWYSKFVWRDWLNDQKLRTVSPAARGYWVDLLCVMHDAEEPGYLTLNGRAATTKEIAKMIPGVGDWRSLERALAELEQAGVCHRDGRGAVFSRRMTRDIGKSRENHENGRKGGNPNLKKNNGLPENTVNPPDKAIVIATRYESESEKKERDPSDLSSPAAPGDATAPPVQPGLPLGQASQPARNASKVTSADIQGAIDAWNELARQHSLPAAQRLHPARKSKIAKRLAQDGGLEGWKRALDMIPKSTFLLHGNERWRGATIDFVAQESSFTKLIEGTYTDQKPIARADEPKPGSRLANLRELDRLRALFAGDADPAPEDDPADPFTIDLTAEEMEATR